MAVAYALQQPLTASVRSNAAPRGDTFARAPVGTATSQLAVEDDARVRDAFMRALVVGDLVSCMHLLGDSPGLVRCGLDYEDSTALHLAVRNGHLQLTQEILQCPGVANGGAAALVNAPDAHARRPLHIACEEGHAELALELLVVGADVNARDDQQRTPIHVATTCGDSVELLQILLERGNAELAEADATGATALCQAAEHGKVQLLEYLVARDPGLVDAPNSCGWAPLHFAAHGRETRNSVKQQKFATCCRTLLAGLANVDALDEDKKTPLHRAADAGNCNTARVLVEARADVVAADYCRWTPLHYAVRNGHLEVAKLLIDSGAPVQEENPSCQTPLSVATLENQVRACELLLGRRADPNFRVKGLASPIMIARQDKGRRDDILSLFELGSIRHHDGDDDEIRARAWPTPVAC